MMLHIGKDTVVPLDEIIAIININSYKKSEANKEFLKIAGEEDFVVRISEDPPKSLVITDTGEKTLIYISPISTSTLIKRSNYKEGVNTSFIDKQGGLFSAKSSK